MYFIYDHRRIVSWCPAILVGVYFIFLAQPAVLKIEPKYDEKPIEVMLATLPEPVQAVIPPPLATVAPEPEVPVEDAIIEEKPKPKVEVKPKIIQPKPEPIVKPIEKPAPKKPVPKVAEVKKTAEVVTEKPSHQVVEKAVETKPIETKNIPVAEKAVEAPPAAVKAAPVEAEKPKPTPPAATGNPSAEANYLHKVRAAVEQQKRYPSGREASLERPEGNVEVWLQVDRSGQVLDSGIASKSKSMLLNRAALSSLQAIKHVEPFPTDAFAGESQKKFVATLNYTAP